MAGKARLPRTDHVWGVDRFPHSPTYGRLVLGVRVPGSPSIIPILLWKEPGAEIAAENVTGALVHDTLVTVTRRKEVNGKDYYYCKVTVKYQGKDYPQRGWVLYSLLKEIGEEYFGL